MAEFRYTEQAERDLLISRVYREENSGPDAARRLLRSIDARCQAIADTPRMGRPRETLLPGLRSLAYDDYTIFYRIEDYGISIQRILYGASDIDVAFPVPEDQDTNL